ncbi:PREDICTED: gamma-2-syntrophin isoform X2 [Chinchilla lanigera]|uniref:gamma-2-syntrophin isoform X2 n=1 Tax=Chinchilla lanigera TaxID=34839 RepID=UPI000695F9E9|nr:PREDICTED: gamma-2-syntrophin isoform X2 [Chinchilla lanigera]
MSAEGPSPPAARRGRPDRLEPARNKTALALLYDEGSENAYDVRLRLTKEALTVQQQDVVCLGGAHPGANHRTVTLRRQPVGGLGLSIKGGAEHCVPVVISKIFKDRAADRSGMLFIGDAVLQVNGIHVEHATHEEVVHLLRNAGDEVTITVEYLREAPSFLKLPLGSPGPSSSHSSRTSSPLFDSGLHLNGHCSHTAPSLPSSPTADEPKYEKRWLDTLSIPLSMARISRYKAGTGSLRSHAFEVLALDGARSGVLQFSTAQDCGDWLHAISANISHLMLQSMKMANKCCSPGNQVVHMGWVNERLQGADSSQALGSKFLALKGSSVYIFSSPPVSTADWLRAENVYNLCEVLFKVHKVRTPSCSTDTETSESWRRWNWDAAAPCSCPRGLQDSRAWLDFDLEDQRPYCFSLLAGQGKSHIFMVELGTELAMWEKAFQRATFLEVQRTGSKTYMCSWQGEVLCFTVDFALGFTCFDSKTKNVLWRFKFSQLKGSSDDGNTRVKLLFQNPDTKQIEMKELEFQDLPAVLHCVHAFMASKVASLDPTFLDSHSLAGRYLHSS